MHGSSTKCTGVLLNKRKDDEKALDVEEIPYCYVISKFTAMYTSDSLRVSCIAYEFASHWKQSLHYPVIYI